MRVTDFKRKKVFYLEEEARGILVGRNSMNKNADRKKAEDIHNEWQVVQFEWSMKFI